MSAIALFHALDARARCLLCLIMSIGSTACLVPRKPLIAPTPVTQGATVVSPKGLNIALAGGAGLLGQRQKNSGIVMSRFGWGFGSNVGVSIGGYGGDEENVTGGAFGQLKVQGTSLFGGRGLWGVHVAAAHGSMESNVQDETLTTWDVALPVEILLSSGTDNWLSAYAGPRFVHNNFTDRENAGGSLTSSYRGLLTGLHAKRSRFRILAEITVAQLPEGTYRGQQVGGRMAVIPMIEIAYTIGTDQLWPGSGN